MHGLSDDDLKLGYPAKASGIHSFSESMEGKELTRNLLQWFLFIYIFFSGGGGGWGRGQGQCGVTYSHRWIVVVILLVGPALHASHTQCVISRIWYFQRGTRIEQVSSHSGWRFVTSFMRTQSFCCLSEICIFLWVLRNHWSYFILLEFENYIVQNPAGFTCTACALQGYCVTGFSFTFTRVTDN